jgi:hypothetical protein
MLDEQLTPKEMATLHDEDDSETDEETGDDPSNVSESFEQAFETRFAYRLGSKLTHFPGEDQGPNFPQTQVNICNADTP